MVQVICPVCGSALTRENSAWRCEKGHSYDVARQGYINLLTVQQKHSLHPGDTREMVLARRNFLGQGHYAPIAQTLCRLVERFSPGVESVLDVGCGEGYYLSQVKAPERWGIDISKEAVRFAAGQDKAACFLTATAAHLPFASGSFDVLLSMFALTVAEEYARVLKENGIFIQVLAGEKHLSALKNIIYSSLREKAKALHPVFEAFTLLHSETLCFDFALADGAAVKDLLYMTPHVWRISREGAAALAQTQQLCDRAEVVFNVYGRQTG